MLYFLLTFCISYFAFPVQTQPVEDVYYQSALVYFNYTERNFRFLLGSIEHDSGIYGSHSPKENVSGAIVLPQTDMYGCQSSYVSKHATWIALVARGYCSFLEKIKNAAKFNASAVIIFDQKGQSSPVVMDTQGADDIVSVSVLYEMGNAVRSLLFQGIEVTGTILPGKVHTDSTKPYRLERASVIFVSVAFMILMMVSLAWLVFYYIQKFRLIRSQHRGAQRERELFTRALALMTTRHLKTPDPLLDAENMCAICIEPYKVSENVRQLPCKHEFHKKCVDPWLQSKHTCPMCKINVMKSLGLMENDNPALEIDEESQHNGGASPFDSENVTPFTDRSANNSPYTNVNLNVSYSDLPDSTARQEEPEFLQEDPDSTTDSCKPLNV